MTSHRSLIFSGWAAISYQVTSAFQAGTLALLVPIVIPLTLALIAVTFFAVTGWVPGRRRPPSEQGRDVR